MPDNSILTAIAGVQDAARAVRTSTDEGMSLLEAACEEHQRGVTRGDIVRAVLRSGGPASRRQLTEAIRELERQLRRLRVAAVHVLIDEEGLSMAEVARLMDVSRQVVSELYHVAPAPPTPDGR